VDWIQQTQDRIQWWGLVNTLTNLPVPLKAEDFFNSSATISFSGGTLLRRVN